MNYEEQNAKNIQSIKKNVKVLVWMAAIVFALSVLEMLTNIFAAAMY